jgi:histidinol-phosphatase (PHP family)
MENSLIESGIFDIIAHPDLIRCHGLYPDYDLTETYHNLAKNAAAHGVAIEMNTTRGKQLGINEAFLNAAAEEGASFSTGSDAHSPEDVGKGIEETTLFIQNSLK